MRIQSLENFSSHLCGWLMFVCSAGFAQINITHKLNFSLSDDIGHKNVYNNASDLHLSPYGTWHPSRTFGINTLF